MVCRSIHEDGGPGNLKPFKDIEKFYEECPVFKMPYVSDTSPWSFDCDDFVGWAIGCAIAKGYYACAVYTPGFHINSIIEVESNRSNKRKFCVVNPQTENEVVTNPGCPTGCWYQNETETEPLESKAGNCVGPNQEIWCDPQKIIGFTNDPYTSFCNKYYCSKLNESGVCVDDILDFINETYPGWNISNGTTFPGGSTPKRTKIRIFRRRR